ncbi:MAG: coproporphyrinogen dehydrogenase HemZ [Gottschalkiaceae bacterium]|nr:coproporphyrinogen dehydrogenase HemZ [Proteiniborus ethanoligenes]TAH63215.1 MAG: coproporphyrinogen dehydrogenase HemZ [Gottschalkiaceae bacterium]
MIYVYLEGHDYRYEVSELIKVFYFNTEIKFIENKALIDNQSLLIVSLLSDTLDKTSVVTRVLQYGETITNNVIDDISKIDIKDNDNIKIYKIAIKQSIYNALSKINTIKVPWGILTGIRPTKIVHELLDKNIKSNHIINILTNEYKLSEEKASLILHIATVERNVVDFNEYNRFSLYVNIPFCPTKCLYCSFLSNPISKYSNLIDIYTDRLIYEINETSKLLKNSMIDTVYIGGGTPTSLPIQNLQRIINKIQDIFGENNIREFTVEAGRPDTINKEMLIMLRENNIRRISINPQTMWDKTLSLIGRKHTSKEIIDAFKLAKKIGFNTVNMDIIVGLPEEGPKEVEATMKEIIKLNPENLTVHTMAIKRSSRLKENLQEYSLAAQSTIEEMLYITRDYADKMGMYPYYMYRQKQILGNFENIGYSKAGKECIYNILIMEEKQTIIAVGAGGVSKFYFPKENRIERVPNLKDLREYLSRTEEMIRRKEKYIKALT